MITLRESFRKKALLEKNIVRNAKIKYHRVIQKNEYHFQNRRNR